MSHEFCSGSGKVNRSAQQTSPALGQTAFCAAFMRSVKSPAAENNVTP